MTAVDISLITLLLFITAGVQRSAVGCTPEKMAQEHVQKLATANNELALNLHKSLAHGSTANVFFSPMSLSTAFGMLFYGTREDTAEELRKVLGYKKAEMPDDLVHATLHRFLTQVAKGSSDAYVLKSANAILVDKQLELVPEYKSGVQELYQATAEGVDFLKDSHGLVEEVNRWVKDKTNGKIDRLLDELSPTTVMVLLNAIYFKGTWKFQFNPQRTRSAPFYNNGLCSAAKEVPLMHMSRHFRHAAMFGCQAVELPYKGNTISMLILLPDRRDGLPSLEQSLTQEKLAQIQDAMSEKKVILALPKFKVQYFKELSAQMKDLGARKIFQAGAADFSGMTTGKNLFVSQVLHKAVVEVNEEGSEATAVTRIVSNRMRPLLKLVPEFRADHPFLFFILERGSGSNLILFMGRVNDL